jgi:hypothetical protein
MVSYSPPVVVMHYDDPPPVRKQNRSCDQCRKGKRRCDAVIPRDWPLSGAESGVKNEQQNQDIDGAGSNTTGRF